jgi:hypothetical protein
MAQSIGESPRDGTMRGGSMNDNAMRKSPSRILTITTIRPPVQLN